MIKTIYLPAFGNHGQPATALKGYPAVPGDKVRLVSCTDDLTGEITHDIWIAKKGSPPWHTLGITRKFEGDDLHFILLAESEIKINKDGQLFADFFVKTQSPLATTLDAIANNTQ